MRSRRLRHRRRSSSPVAGRRCADQATSTRRAPRPPALGIVTVSSPSFSSAPTLSMSICSGRTNAREKRPWPRSMVILLAGRLLTRALSPRMTMRLFFSVDPMSSRDRPGTSMVRTKLPAVSNRSTGGFQPGASLPTS